jgi:ABC-type bacteriocin/lantibiotic exporter with double-glycine peptidase domain
MKKTIFLGFLILFLAGVTLLGCTAGPPIKHPQLTKSNLPQKYLIENVPIYRQPYMDCGPTSLRMVLNFYGQNLSQEEIGKARKGRGTTVSDLESYARSAGFEVYSFYDLKKEDMKYFIAQGYPLIALGVVPPEWSKGQRYSGDGHFVVLVGYNDLKNIFNVNDPNGGRRLEIPYDVFKRFHSSHPTKSDYVICVYPKSK